MNNPVKSPPHYSVFDGKYEVIDLIQDRLVSLKHSEFKPNNPIVYSNYANVLKYACRWHHKGGIQDLKKMVEYAEMIIDQYEHEEAIEILEDEMVKGDLYSKAFEENSSFDKVSSEYYEALYGTKHWNKMERGPF